MQRQAREEKEAREREQRARAQAEQVLKEGKSMAKQGDKYLFGVHSLLAQVLQERGDMAGMVTELEAAAKKPG